MTSLRILPLFVLLFALCGCGYVHFGRLPPTAARGDDSSLSVAYSNLSTENKILQQELALAHKEGSALRAVLEDRSADGSASAALTARLNDTTRELGALRVSYAKLSAARGAQPPDAPPDPALQAKLSGLEEQLASSLRNYTQLQEENGRLRAEVDRTRSENTALAAQVKTVTAQNADAQAALAQLNTELLAQKEARARAEQQTAAARAQLNAVLSRPDRGEGAQGSAVSSLGTARETAAGGAATLQIPKSPPPDASVTAELRTSSGRPRDANGGDVPPKTDTPAPRIHVVKAGDTLESIARQYYGTPEKWRVLYLTNNALLSGGRPLRPGMELEIPPN